MEKPSANELVRANLTHINESGETYQSGASNSVHSNRQFKEIMGSHSVLSNTRNRIFTSKAHPEAFDPGLAAARFMYLFSGSNELEPISFYSQGVNRFSDDGKTLTGSAYGHRLFASLDDGINQMENLLNMLQNQRNSTRGTLSIYEAKDCGRESKDIPCALDFTLSPRNDVLHATLSMRANACLRLMPYNLFEFTMIQEWVAQQCNLALGKYHHSVVSLHIRDDEMAIASDVANESVTAPEMGHMPKNDRDFRQTLLSEEGRIRDEIHTWTRGAILRKIENLHQDFGEYWGDFLSTLSLRAFRVTHVQEETQKLTQDLMETPNGPLLETTRNVYSKNEIEENVC